MKGNPAWAGPRADTDKVFFCKRTNNHIPGTPSHVEDQLQPSPRPRRTPGARLQKNLTDFPFSESFRVGRYIRADVDHPNRPSPPVNATSTLKDLLSPKGPLRYVSIWLGWCG